MFEFWKYFESIREDFLMHCMRERDREFIKEVEKSRIIPKI